MGHEDPFPARRLSARYVIRQETFAGTHGNGRDAPKPALRLSWVVRVKPTPNHAFKMGLMNGRKG